MTSVLRSGAPMRPVATSSRRLETTGEPIVGGADRRKESRENAREDGNAEGKRQDRSIHPNRIHQTEASAAP